MRNIGHWTPRYVVNRLRWGAYQRRNMDKPWLTPEANRHLATLLRPTDVGIEWGSGRSTAWLAARMRHLTSIENHAGWYEKVKGMLAERRITNVDYRHLDVANPPDDASSPYVLACDAIADRSLGFALVDGEARDHCANAVLPKLAPGALLVVDNINWYLDHPTYSPASRDGAGPATPGWARFAEAVNGWRMIWTSSGVSDTAMWFKPCE